MTDKTTELVPSTGSTSLAETGRPEWLPRTNEGTEHIGRDDMKIPRLSIAQGLSDQIKRDNPKFIPGLGIGDLFNDLTGQIYTERPVPFYIVRADPPRFIEWRPRSEGGGIVDPNVPAGDPRTLFTTNEKGERVKPVAMMYYDYIILLGEAKEMIALSLKSSGIKIAKHLNGLIKARNAPLWAGRYVVDVKDEPSPNGPFPNYVIRPAGPGPLGFVQSKEEADQLKAVFEAIKGREFVIEREPGEEDESTRPSAPTDGSNDNIPF